MMQVNVVNTSLDKHINQAVYSTLRRHLIAPPNKRQKKSLELVPIVFGLLRTTHSSTPLRILLDSGASSTLIKASKTNELKKIATVATQWTTSSGSFNTTQKVEVNVALPELSNNRTICTSVHVAPKLNQFDMIIGRDLLSNLGITLNFKDHKVQWDDIEIPMKPENATRKEYFHIADSPTMDAATERIKHILDAKYEAANLKEIADSCTHLTEEKRQSLQILLEKYKSLFDGSLGTWTGDPYNIELKPDATPYHARAFPIPKVHEQTLKMEVNRLVELRVLKKVNRSEWAAPTFIIPKKDGTVRFISDFRQLNLRIRRKPFPIPKIQDLLMKLEGFQYATSLDLNMGYYHIELTPTSKALCTIVLPWGKYEYQRLPMGLCNSPDIFQEKMSSLVSDLEYCRAYIDDLLILSAGSWDQHLTHLDTVFGRLKEAGLKVNAKKSFFGKPELEYLGYWITRKGIQPIPKKIDAIQNLAPPTTVRELRRFIGLINYYRDMWIRRSDVLTPLTALVSKNAKWQWTDVEQKAFDTMKRIIAKEVLLSYPDFSKPFVIHTDASNTQLGAVISQENRPIAFYSRKLNLAQTRYTTTERELLAIVETLKEFRNILLGQQIIIHTDHKNLTHKNFNTERVLRWRLILEEFGPDLQYIKGEKNIVADALIVALA
jgi:predicted aspartyl protease